MISFYLNDENKKIVFSEKAIHIFNSNIQQIGCSEAGGQLFARFANACIFVEEVTGPNKLDKRKRFSFVPDRVNQRNEIDEMYSKGLHFIGDWHTHPEKIPNPSNLDLKSIKECFKSSEHDLKGFLLVIIGTDSFPKNMYVAIVNESEVKALKPYDE